MSDKKELVTIYYHNDDDTNMHYIGEIDGVLSDDIIDDFIKRFGDKGVSDLIEHFAFLIYKVKDRQYRTKKINSRGKQWQNTAINIQ